MCNLPYFDEIKYVLYERFLPLIFKKMSVDSLYLEGYSQIVYRETIISILSSQKAYSNFKKRL